MRIIVNKKELDENNFVVLELANLDGETWFHVRGLLNGWTINFQLFTHESDYAASHANDLYLEYAAKLGQKEA